MPGKGHSEEEIVRRVSGSRGSGLRGQRSIAQGSQNRYRASSRCGEIAPGKLIVG